MISNVWIRNTSATSKVKLKITYSTTSFTAKGTLEDPVPMCWKQNYQERDTEFPLAVLREGPCSLNGTLIRTDTLPSSLQHGATELNKQKCIRVNQLYNTTRTLFVVYMETYIVVVVRVNQIVSIKVRRKLQAPESTLVNTLDWYLHKTWLISSSHPVWMTPSPVRFIPIFCFHQ